METKVETFKIEKGVKPARRGRTLDLPEDYFKIKATMDVLEREESFVFPLNGYKSSTVTSWVTRIDEELASKILDIELRKKNKRTFYRNVIKDAEKNETGVRIFRIA